MSGKYTYFLNYEPLRKAKPKITTEQDTDAEHKKPGMLQTQGS